MKYNIICNKEEELNEYEWYGMINIQTAYMTYVPKGGIKQSVCCV